MDSSRAQATLGCKSDAPNERSPWLHQPSPRIWKNVYEAAAAATKAKRKASHDRGSYTRSDLKCNRRM